jgi:hypothetical protein
MVEELRTRPEDLTTQRCARLLLLLEIADGLELKKPLDLERLSYYDFFSANPFALFDSDEPEARAIVLAGFTADDLSYQSSGHRFVTRRARLQMDLAYLLARGLVAVTGESRRVVHRITPAGAEVSAQLTSLYAQSFRVSSHQVLSRLDRLSDAALAGEARRRLEATGQLVDLYGFSRGGS